MNALDDLLTQIEAGNLPPVPESLTALVAEACASGPPYDVVQWSETLADGIAAAGDE